MTMAHELQLSRAKKSTFVSRKSARSHSLYHHTVRLLFAKRRRTWMSRQSSGSIRDREYGYIYHGTRSREVHTSSEALVRQSHAPQICSSRSWLWPTPCAFRTSSAHRRPLTTPSSRPCPDVPLWTRTTDRRPHSAPRVCMRTRLRSPSAIPPLFRRLPELPRRASAVVLLKIYN